MLMGLLPTRLERVKTHLENSIKILKSKDEDKFKKVRGPLKNARNLLFRKRAWLYHKSSYQNWPVKAQNWYPVLLRNVCEAYDDLDELRGEKELGKLQQLCHRALIYVNNAIDTEEEIKELFEDYDYNGPKFK